MVRRRLSIFGVGNSKGIHLSKEGGRKKRSDRGWG